MQWTDRWPMKWNRKLTISVSLWLTLLYFVVYDPASVEVVVWAVHEALYPIVDTTIMDEIVGNVEDQ
jgi:hypothetical protein